MIAEQFLRQGADVLAERGKEYDKPEGERSMARCVAAFNAITGKDLTEAEGWAFMVLLKMVRQWQNPDRYHEDSAIDGVNYSALMAEALSNIQPTNAFQDAPPHATHKLKSPNGSTLFAYQDAGHMRDCHTQYKIDTALFSVVATRNQ